MHPPHGVVDVALERAADLTGIDLSFMLGTAGKESGYDPRARNRASSATGLFQFVDQSWLATLKRHGARYGYARYAAMIERGSDGRWRARDEAGRAEIMRLRLDARASALMAGEMAADHAAALRAATGRSPSAGELYAAHFLGGEGAAKLVAESRSRPGASAPAIFPEAARANPSLFWRGGKAVTVRELYAQLTGRAPPAASGEDGFARWAAAARAERAQAHRVVIQAALQRRAAPG